jgi:hemolysin activation/secretion protein
MPRSMKHGGCVRGSREWLALLSVVALLPLQAYSQQGADRQFVPPPEARPSAPITVGELTPDQDAPADAATHRFALRSLSITGNSAFSQDELLSSYRGLLGQEIGLDRIYAIAAELTARHRNAGYLLTVVTVPPQTITDGAVSFRATEGFVDDVIFEGDTTHRPSLLAAVKRRLLASRPLSLPLLERELLLLNDLPGLSAHATLARSPTPGASQLLVRLSQRRLEFSAGANNRGSELLGPTQGDVGVELYSLFTLRDRTALRYVTTGNDELEYLSLAHQQLVSSRGTALTLSASTSNSAPPVQNVLEELSVETESTQFGIELTHPFIRSRRLNFSGRLSLTHHDGKTEFPFFAVNLSEDRITAARVGFTFDGTDSWRGVNIVDIEFGKGLSALGASDFGEVDASRLGGRPDFSKATLYLARLQSIAPRWSVLLAASGQMAFNNLLSSEEFAFGGEFFGRAYDASELVGDSGYAGKLELRYTQPFGAAWNTTFYAFGETGRVYRRLAPAETVEKEESASSAGAGIRFDVLERVSGYVEYAKPISRDVASTGDDDGRVFGGIRIRF